MSAPTETVVVCFDVETRRWALLGAQSGKCYSHHATKAEAEAALTNLIG